MQVNDNLVELKEVLGKVIRRVDGMEAVFLTDRDGVVLVSASVNEAIKDDQNMVNTYMVAHEQAGKLSLGKNKSITSMYNNFIIVHMESLPQVVITMIARSGSNVGLMLGLGNEIIASLGPLKDIVQQ